MKPCSSTSRRQFIANSATAMAGALVLSPSPALAINRANYAPPLQELLPADFKIVKAERPYDIQHMKFSKLSLIPSINYDHYSKTWNETLRDIKPGIIQKAVGVRDETWKGFSATSDPRLFTDNIFETLQPLFNEIDVAPDFPSARESGSQYYCVVDFWAKMKGMWSSYYEVRSSLNVFDSNLHALATEKYTGKFEVKDPGLFSGPQGLADSITQALYESMQSALRTLLPSITNQLMA